MTSRRSLDFGSNYGPHLERVRDFYPHWIENQWDEAGTIRELSILRSLGARRVRFHIVPARYDLDRYPGVNAEHYRRLIPLALRTAHTLGMKTHLDLHTDDYTTLTAEPLLDRIAEFGPENIDTLQIINEYFFLWKDEGNLRKQTELFARLRQVYAGELCFDAGGTVHRQMRAKHPELAAYMTAMLPLHYYAGDDHWDDFNIDLLIDVLNGGNRQNLEPLSPERRKYAESMRCEHFGGLAPDLRIMEINLVGHFANAGMVRGDRGARWPEMMRRVAAETDVTTVCTWCFFGKMGWREYGFSQAGMVYACGLPRPEAKIFRDTAQELMPPDDIFSRFTISIDAPGGDRVTVRIANLTNVAASGALRLTTGACRPVELAPRAEAVSEFSLDEALDAGGNGRIRHILAEFIPNSAPAGVTGKCLGWRAAPMPSPIRLAPEARFPISGVSYPEGYEPITAWLEANRNRLCILVEQPGAPETELAIRLQSIMAEAFGVLPEVASLMLGAGTELVGRALILLGTPDQNALWRYIGCCVATSCLPPQDAPGAAVSVHPALFRQKPLIDKWPASQHRKCIGNVQHSPGALLVAGSSFPALRDAVYDLIQRMSPPGPTAMACDDTTTMIGESGFPLGHRKQFGVRLPADDYHVEVTVGSRRHRAEYATRVTIAAGPSVDRQIAAGRLDRVTQCLRHDGSLLVVQFEPAVSGQLACPTTLRVMAVRTGEFVFQAYFSASILVPLDYEGFKQVSEAVILDRSVSTGDWQEIRAAANQGNIRQVLFGWVTDKEEPWTTTTTC